MGDAYFGFYLLAMGRAPSRTAAEQTKVCCGAPASGIRRLATARPLLAGAVIAHRV